MANVTADILQAPWEAGPHLPDKETEVRGHPA